MIIETPTTLESCKDWVRSFMWSICVLVTQRVKHGKYSASVDTMMAAIR